MFNHNEFKEVITSYPKMGEVLESLEEEIVSKFKQERPRYIVALETKGALLLDIILKNHPGLLQKVVYKRALDFIPDNELQNAKVAVVDDTFIRGKTLRDICSTIKSLGAKTLPMACFNFASGTAGKDYDAEMLEKTWKPSQGCTTRLSHDEVLHCLQHILISSRLPPSFGHLVFRGSASKSQWTELLGLLEESGRLLYYGRRGPTEGASITLDDLCADVGWSVPPKIRLWHKDATKTLCISPMAFPEWRGISAFEKDPLYLRLEQLLRPLRTSDSQASMRCRYDGAAITARMGLLGYLKQSLGKCDINCSLERQGLERSYPHAWRSILELLGETYDKLPSLPLSNHPSYRNDAELHYLPTAKSITLLLKQLYKSQRENGLEPVNFESKGLTVVELLKRFSHRDPREVHAAIDYCADMNYVTAFPRLQEGALDRALRTTETPPRFPVEFLAAQCIYSDDKKSCPSWRVAKAFGTLQQALADVHFDGMVACGQGPRGGISHAITEIPDNKWTDLSSDYWTVVSQTGSPKVKEFRKTRPQVDVLAEISRDEQTKPYHLSLEAVSYLFRQGGYPAGVLLSILTDGVGGTSYLSYNCHYLLEFARRHLHNGRLSEDEADSCAQHQQGLEEKLRFLAEESHYPRRMESLRRRVTRLRETPTVAQRADDILEKARLLSPEPGPTQEPNFIYQAFKRLGEPILQLNQAALAGNVLSIHDALGQLGFIAPGGLTGQALALYLQRNVQPQVNRWRRALSASTEKQMEGWKSPVADFEGEKYIVGYDLRGARKGDGKTGECILAMDYHIHAMFGNWFHAFGGVVNDPPEITDDERYAAFASPDAAFAAACWSAYSADTLSSVNEDYASKPIAGIALARERVKIRGGRLLGGPDLDTVGHHLKGKDVKKACSEIAGRAITDQVCLLDQGTFLSGNLSYTPYLRAAQPKPGTDFSHIEDYLNSIRGIDYRAFVRDYLSPWKIKGT